MLTNGRLIELALGRDEARHVDTAIPQSVFDAQYPGQREQNAGWYYDRGGTTDGPRSLTGRLLTVEECWGRVRHRLDKGKLQATMMGLEIPAFICLQWKCFEQHVQRGEIILEEA
jgi:hypothetical protein